MRPDRSNYEIWIIDWLDGKLDSESTALLIRFLDQNPDLKEEAESLSVASLNKELTLCPDKESLKRSASELPLSQVEYLSVAFLENDITEGQMADLQMNIDKNKENKKVFNEIQKIKLTPPDIKFKNKSLLRKQTFEAKIIRLATAGLSAAAAVAILITGYISLQKHQAKNDSDSRVMVSSIYTGQPLEVTSVRFKANPERPVFSKKAFPIEYKTYSQSLPVINEIVIPETASLESETIEDVHVSLIPELKPEIKGRCLASTNNTYIKAIASYDDDRSRLSKFIARNFREKLLKETVPSESPLKTYEIAEAGIEGLNKLLGWNMTLIATNDEQGEVKSVYFSSKMLKFNAPVKKSEPQP